MHGDNDAKHMHHLAYICSSWQRVCDGSNIIIVNVI